MAPQAGGRQQQRDSTSMSEDGQPFPALDAEQTAEFPLSNGETDDDHDHVSTTLEDEGEVEIDDDADFQSHYSVENDLSDSSDEESEDDEDDSIEDTTAIHHRPFTQPSNSSLHGPNAFAPPFYNR